MPLQITGEDAYPRNKQVPILVYGPNSPDITQTIRLDPNNDIPLCRPSFHFRRWFEQPLDLENWGLSSSRAAYTQDGFLFCGINGGNREYKQEVSNSTAATFYDHK